MDGQKLKENEGIRMNPKWMAQKLKENEWPES
jgi:hypothetical protein